MEREISNAVRSETDIYHIYILIWLRRRPVFAEDDGSASASELYSGLEHFANDGEMEDIFQAS